MCGDLQMQTLLAPEYREFWKMLKETKKEREKEEEKRKEEEKVKRDERRKEVSIFFSLFLRTYQYTNSSMQYITSPLPPPSSPPPSRNSTESKPPLTLPNATPASNPSLFFVSTNPLVKWLWTSSGRPECQGYQKKL